MTPEGSFQHNAEPLDSRFAVLLEEVAQNLGLSEQDLLQAIATGIKEHPPGSFKFLPMAMQKSAVAGDIDSVRKAVFFLAANSSANALPARPESGVPLTRRTIQARLAPAGEKVLQKSIPPHAFPLGKEVHRTLERLIKEERIVGPEDQNVMLFEESDGSGVGHIAFFTDVDGASKTGQHGLFTSTVDVGESASNTQKLEADPTLLHVKLPEKLPVRNGDYLTSLPIVFALDTLKYAIDHLRFEASYLLGAKRLPETPGEILTIMRDDRAFSFLKIVVGAAHIITGDVPRLSLIRKDKTGLLGEIILAEEDRYKLLNWLVLARKFTEYRDNGSSVSETATYAELNSSKVHLDFPTVDETGKTNHNIVALTGGVFDSIGITLHSAKVGERTPHANVASLGRDMEKRMRKKGVKRNFVTVVKEFVRHLGTEALLNASIVINDNKAWVGDFGPFYSGDRTKIPRPSQVRQMQDYLIFSLIQICSVTSTSWLLTPDDLIAGTDMGGKEYIPVDLDTFGKFLQETRMHERIVAILEYLTPDESLYTPIRLPSDVDKILARTKQLFQTRIDKNREKKDRVALVRAIERLTTPLHFDVETRVNPPAQVPPQLEHVMASEMGRLYLGLTEIFQEGINFRRIIQFHKEGVYVLFSSNLIQGQTVRLAIDTNTSNFNMTFIDEAGQKVSMKGILRTDISKHLGVASDENPAHMQTELEEVLKVLTFGNRVKEFLGYESANELNNPIGEDGLPVEVVAGKPIVMRINQFTGRWSLDKQLFEIALVDTTKDVFGFARLHNVLTSGESAVVQCPHPSHANMRAESPALQVNERGTGYCHGCDRFMLLKIDSPGNLNFLRLSAPKSVEDFRSISRKKEKTLAAVVRLGNIFARYSPEVWDYLATRGLNGDALYDVGWWPSNLTNFLLNITYGSILSDHQQEERLIDIQDFTHAINNLLTFIKDPDQLCEVNDLLTVGLVQDIDRYNIFRSKEEKGKPKKHDLMGERVMLPLYFWTDKYPGDGLVLRISGMYGRALPESGHRTLLHFKTPMTPDEKKSKMENGRLRHRRPIGFWLSSPPEHFVEEIAKYDGEVVITEAPLDAASFKKLEQRLPVIGVGSLTHGALIPWLISLGITTVNLALDFDSWGTEATAKRAQEMQAAGIVVQDGYKLLMPIIRDLPDVLKSPGNFKDINDLLKYYLGIIGRS